MPTATLPVKPLTAVASKVTEAPVWPATIVSIGGARLRVKSGAGGGVAAAVTVSATEDAWVRSPEVPVIVTVAAAVAATAVACSATVWATPGASVSVMGAAVTPAGKPLILTATLAVKPPVAVARTVIADPDWPATIVSEAGALLRLKSGVAAGVGAGVVGAGDALEPELQPARHRAEKKRLENKRRGRKNSTLREDGMGPLYCTAKTRRRRSSSVRCSSAADGLQSLLAM
jgi:hypothetical protein